MAVAIALLPYMWKAWWRKLKQKGVWHGANQTMVMGIAFLGFIGIMVASIVALKSLRQDSISQGMMIWESTLSSVMMFWLMVPIMVGSTTAEGRGVQPMRMGQFPLSGFSLMAIGMLGRLIQPVYWILIGASLLSLLPMFAVANPTLGLIAGILFLIFSAMMAWCVELFTSAIFTSRRGREIMMVVVLLLIVPIFAIVQGDFSMDGGDITFAFGDRIFLLFNEAGTDGLLTQARAFSPSIWVSGSADGSAGLKGILLLGLAAVLSCALAWRSLRRVMLHPPGSLGGRKVAGRAIGTLPGLSQIIGPLVVKELRYLTRTLDHLMGVGMSLVGFAWIMIRPEHLVFVLPLGIMNIVFNESAIPLNTFGLDGSGADRYRLLPLSGRQVILTKNIAYFLIVGIHIIPLVLAGLFNGGAMLSLVAVLATGAACLGTVSGGNFASINSPAPRAFFNFDSKEQTGGTLALIMAAALWLFPTGVYFGLVWIGMWAATLGMLALLGISVLVYRKALDSAGRSFDESSEKMRGRLSNA